MKIRPLHDRVAIKRIEEKEMTDGGIIIPHRAKEKPLEGKIVAVGKGKTLEDGSLRAMDLKVGDHVLFSRYTGTEVQILDEEHLMMREEDVLGIIEQ